MSMLARGDDDEGLNIKSLYHIPIKSRSDSLSDQYNRLLMVKLLTGCAIILGVCWYYDKMQCIVPDTHASSGDDSYQNFISQTCWIQGLYVYKELRKRVDDAAYYGIPKDIDNNGLMDGKYLCNVEDKFFQKNKKCIPMEKTFFLQYQWLPFFVASLCLLYYVPYILFVHTNSKLIQLKRQAIKGINAEKIFKSYFKKRESSKFETIKRIMLNLFIKLCFIFANGFSLVASDVILNNGLIHYGKDWIKWNKLNNTMQYDYMGLRDYPKPGNELLPPFGYCEIYESARDVKQSFANKHKILCELSQNVLYQYVFLILWFAFVIGIIVSSLGFVYILIGYIRTYFSIRKTNNNAYPCKVIRFQHREYLDIIKANDMVLYADVCEEIRKNDFPTEQNPIPMHTQVEFNGNGHFSTPLLRN